MSRVNVRECGENLGFNMHHCVFFSAHSFPLSLISIKCYYYVHFPVSYLPALHVCLDSTLTSEVLLSFSVQLKLVNH